MEAPILQITVLEGPRNGEILVCNPKSTIHIGRVIRGNNLALRDPGISQKHLCFRFIQDDFRWFVSDLDTSNGTTLNGSRIEASVLVPVSDGDVFEIGEKTKLGVKVVPGRVLEGKGDGNNVRGRRITRRGGSSVNTRANSSRVSGEEVKLKEAHSKISVPVRRRRKNVTPAMASSHEEEKEILNPDLIMDSGVEMGQKGTGRGRGDIVTRSNARVLEKQEPRDSVRTEESDQNGEAKVRRNPRRGKSSRFLKELDGNCAVDSVLGVKEVDMKRKVRGGGRGTASTVSEFAKENDDNLVLKLNIQSSDPDHVAIPEPRKGVKVRTIAGSSMVIEEEGEEDVGVEGERNCEELKVDFEKMTLDQWFDSMELFLPKVLHEECEKIIGTLKEKARKFDELLEVSTDSA
jgi:pSer/pThr/pTyr-binding forkhead associated (FHA) protein